MHNTVSTYWRMIQKSMFPGFCEELGPTTNKHQELMVILDILEIEKGIYIPPYPIGPGRPKANRAAIARAFVAKAVFNFATTRALLDRLAADPVLRRICGFGSKRVIPCETTFSNAFAEFSKCELGQKIHARVVTQKHEGILIHHISRDSTAIEARERYQKEPKPQQQKFSRGRPRKGEVRPPKEESILKKQAKMTLREQLKSLPKVCDTGAKYNGAGHLNKWKGYKLHIDDSDGGVPVTCLLTSASVHDSAAAIPLETMTSKRLTSLYTLMDSAYDAPEIRQHVTSFGKIPVIDNNPRRRVKIPFDPPKKERFKVRTESERVNSQLKDLFGARFVRVKGPQKVMCHLMFGVLSLTALRLVMLS